MVPGGVAWVRGYGRCCLAGTALERAGDGCAVPRRLRARAECHNPTAIALAVRSRMNKLLGARSPSPSPAISAECVGFVVGQVRSPATERLLFKELSDYLG